MEKSYCSILDNFTLVSIVMPYYGFTHRMYLVLSALSKRTRMNLHENYKVFRRIMVEYTMEKWVYAQDLHSENLPYDLFKFYIKRYFFWPKIDDIISLSNIIIKFNTRY